MVNSTQMVTVLILGCMVCVRGTGVCRNLTSVTLGCMVCVHGTGVCRNLTAVTLGCMVCVRGTGVCKNLTAVWKEANMICLSYSAGYKYMHM